LLATKSVTQPFQNHSFDGLLTDCLILTYNAIHHGQEIGITNRKAMKGFYRSLKNVHLPSCYKVRGIPKNVISPDC
jgi:hypothetical protein